MNKIIQNHPLTQAKPSDKTALETISPPIDSNAPHKTTPIIEVAPSAKFVPASSAPVATPADPGAPSATSTTIGEGYLARKTHKQRLRLVLVVIGILLIIAVVIATFAVIGKN